MTDIAWDDDVIGWFDPSQNGTAPDVVVHGTSFADWSRLLELIVSRHWRAQYRLGDQWLPVPVSATDLLGTREDDSWGQLWLWPAPDLEWVVQAGEGPGEIVGHVSLYEIQGQRQLDVFCGFLRQLGGALGRRVVMYSEGSSAFDDQRCPPLLAYEPDEDRVRFLAGQWR